MRSRANFSPKYLFWICVSALIPLAFFAMVALASPVAPKPSLLVYQPAKIADLKNVSVFDAAERGIIDLSSEFSGILNYCKQRQDDTACSNRMSQLTRSMSAADAARFSDLFARYRAVEDRAPVYSTVSELREYRKSRLDDQSYELLYGLRDALQKWQDTQASIVEGTILQGNSSSRKVTEFLNLRKEVLGQYHDIVTAQEPPEAKYGYEVMLIQNELAAMSPEAQSIRVRQIREQYFSPEQISQMEAQTKTAQAEEEKALARVDAFLIAEAKLLADNPQWSADTRRLELEKLRLYFFTTP